MLTDLQKQILKGEICPYCKMATQFVDSSVIYGVSYGMIYLCKPCDAFCGVYKDSNISLGRLANKSLRNYKKLAHKHFDKIWKSGYTTRSELYEALSDFLKIPKEYTHIGMFGELTCQKVVDWSIETLNNFEKKIK